MGSKQCCELIGMNLDEAVKFITVNNVYHERTLITSIRIVKEDDNSLIVLSDYNMNRINVHTKDSIITKIYDNN